MPHPRHFPLSLWPEDCEEKARLCHTLPPPLGRVLRVLATSSPAEIRTCPPSGCLLAVPGDGGWSRAWGRVSRLYLHEPVGHPIRSLSFFFLLWWILSYTEMKQPWVYMCSPSQSPLPPPSPPNPSRSSHCTRSECLSHASNLGC